MSQLDDFIVKCDEAMVDEWDYGDVVSLRATIYNAYRKEIRSSNAYRIFDADVPDLTMIRAWLVAHKERLAHELAIAQANGGMVNVSNSATSTATASATANVDFAQAIDAIEELPDTTLSEAEKNELLGMLSRIEAAEAKQDPTVKEKAFNVLKWIGDKSVDVAIAAAPVLLKALMG